MFFFCYKPGSVWAPKEPEEPTGSSSRLEQDSQDYPAALWFTGPRMKRITEHQSWKGSHYTRQETEDPKR